MKKKKICTSSGFFSDSLLCVTIGVGFNSATSVTSLVKSSVFFGWLTSGLSGPIRITSPLGGTLNRFGLKLFPLIKKKFQVAFSHYIL